MARPVLFFDFGGTLAQIPPLLWEPWRVWVRVGREIGLELPEAQIREANEEADRRFRGQIYAYHGRTGEFWRLRDTWMIGRLGVRDRREELFDGVQTTFNDPSIVRLYPETRGVLEDLRTGGFPMGVISNFTDRLIALLDHHGLLGMFETVTYSQEVGAEKPDGRVFAQALQRTNHRPADAVHVGDSWTEDYVGARSAGLRAIWLNRLGAEPPEPCEMVSDLRGVLPLLVP